jgi:nonribosomal peptide synthetase DhbF
MIHESMTNNGVTDEREMRLPLSAAQLGVWFAQKIDPANPIYNIGQMIEVNGPVDPSLFNAAVTQAVIDTEALRVRLVEEIDSPRQLIGSPSEISMPLLDVSAELDPQAAAEAWMKADLAKPVDLLRGPLFHFALFKAAPARFFWYQRYHHVLIDGFGVVLFKRRVADIYTALVNNLPCGGNPFGSLAVLLEEDASYRASERFARDQRYWLEYLADRPEPVSLSARPATNCSCFLSQSAHLPPSSAETLRSVAQRARAGLPQIIVAATALYLHRLTGAQDLVLGLPVTGRLGAVSRRTPGMLSNVLPLRLTVHPGMSLSQLIEKVAEHVRRGLLHQRYRTEDLNRDLGLLAHNQNLFGTSINVMAFDHELLFAGHRTTTRNLSNGPVEDLSIVVYDRSNSNELRIDFDANPALYGADELANHQQRFLRLLERASADPQRPIGRLELMAFEERRQILVDWNDTACEIPNTTLPALFEAQVKRSPDATALVFDDSALTYAQLDARANLLAHRLIDAGIGPEILVALALPRSIEMVVGLLAILKAGGAYVPLDPAFPAERLRYIMEDSGAKVLVTQRALSEAFFSGLNLVRVYLDDDKDQIERQSSEPLVLLAEPSNRAYVIYTSGSTACPKGVEIEHRALTNFLCSMARKPGLTEKDVLLAVTTPAFDIAGLELFLPLITGARIELASRETASDGAALGRTLSTSGATVMQATPATWRMLFESGWKGDRRLKVLCGGEAMDRDLAARLVSTCGSVWNMYGPTETTIWSSLARIESDEVTIGRPVANTRMYVLNGHREPVPRGAVGELWIGGEGLARGYLNRAELTRERFIEDPFHKGDRMYRTGDLARHLQDGRLECLGRIDNQVKIRGYRIELEEIEAVLSTHEAVRHCVVAAREQHAGDARLLAYVVPKDAHRPTIEDLRRCLRTVLPDYMIPSAFAFLDAIPLTPNGKIDRRALPIPGADMSDLTDGYVAPRNQVEQVMAEIWAEVLGMKSVGVFDHFFELGGHSLSATRLIARLKSAFQIDLPLRSIFIEPTIAGLCKHILYDEFTQRYYHVGEISRWNRLVPAQPKGSRIPFFMVAGFMDADDTLRVLSRLIPHLGLDQPVYGLRPRWLDGHSERYSGAAEIASEFLADLRAVQPKGPYLLGGDCAGGVVAFEMAQELLRLGEEVRLLVMLDTYRPSVLSALGLRLYYAWGRVKHILNVIGQIIRTDVPLKLQLVRDLGRRKLKPAHALSAEELAFQRVYRLRMDYMRTMYRHRVKKYPGQIALIVNELRYKVDKYMGWKGIASGGLQIHSTAGGHWTRYLHGQELAKQLLGCLERAQAGGA